MKETSTLKTKILLARTGNPYDLNEMERMKENEKMRTKFIDKNLLNVHLSFDSNKSTQQKSLFSIPYNYPTKKESSSQKQLGYIQSRPMVIHFLTSSNTNTSLHISCSPYSFITHLT